MSYNMHDDCIMIIKIDFDRDAPKIEGIRLLKYSLGMGLKEAKDLFEEILAHQLLPAFRMMVTDRQFGRLAATMGDNGHVAFVVGVSLPPTNYDATNPVA